MHVDGIAPGQRVLVVDDVLATGGTAEAACELVEQVGGVVAGSTSCWSWGSCGRQQLSGREVRALVASLSTIGACRAGQRRRNPEAVRAVDSNLQTWCWRLIVGEAAWPTRAFRRTLREAAAVLPGRAPTWSVADETAGIAAASPRPVATPTCGRLRL